MQIVPGLSRRVVRVVVVKLLSGACAYFIWQEHNNRLFKTGTRLDNYFFILSFQGIQVGRMQEDGVYQG